MKPLKRDYSRVGPLVHIERLEVCIVQQHFKVMIESNVEKAVREVIMHCRLPSLEQYSGLSMFEKLIHSPIKACTVQVKIKLPFRIL